MAQLIVSQGKGVFHLLAGHSDSRFMTVKPFSIGSVDLLSPPDFHCSLCLQLIQVEDVEFWRNPEKQGWMHSQGEVIKSWRRRWFVLKQVG